MMFRAMLVCLTVGTPALGASLKPVTSLSTSVVRLSDLFDDAGAEADRVLGPAPAPGGRIVVESAQLAAIARQFGVDWKPNSRTDRAVLDRPGRPMTREAINAAMRAALRGNGSVEDVDIELPGLTPPMLPLGSLALPVVSGLDHDSTTGQFTGLLSVTGPDFPAIHMPLAGRTHAMLDLVVPTRRVLPSDVLRAEDLRPVRVRAETIRVETAREPGDAIGFAPRRPLSAGQPLALADLMRPALVHKGKPVMLVLDGPGLTLAAQGLALEDGAAGAHIRVQNPSSRAVLEAIVLGPDRARVLPDSAPVSTTLAAAR